MFNDYYSNICECKNNEPDFSLKRSVSNCNTICKENPSEFCGGVSRDGSIKLENIYKTKYSGMSKFK